MTFAQSGASIEEEYIENEKNIEMTLRIEKALSKLTERQRYVVKQVFWEQKSLREIVRELGVHHSTIAQTYAAAIKKLKKLL
ncbi:MAG: sigma-70 family RNA polymerase sigma factor [Clostridiales bacterium]|nr:sigma-70 family RNA polymerase sigma factor [Clostridiales bacterium]